MDRIHIEGLLLRCIIGVNPEERVEKQDVVIDLTLHCDLRRSGRSDDLADTVNYTKIKKQIRHLVENSSYLLIEKLAAEVARVCLATPGVEQVRVRIDKPGALRFTKTVAVEIERTAADQDESCPSAAGSSGPRPDA